MIEPSPCPFCGSTDLSTLTYAVVCLSCRAVGPRDMRRTVEAWNERKLVPAPDEPPPGYYWGLVFALNGACEMIHWDGETYHTTNYGSIDRYASAARCVRLVYAIDVPVVAAETDAKA